MVFRSALIGLVAAALGTLASGSVGAQQKPAFRAGVDLVALNVTVTTRENRYVSDLTETDFTVFEDGRPQPLRYFAKTGVPLAVALLLDTSASMEDTLLIAQEAAIGFVRELSERDVATVVDFDSRVQVLQGFTNATGALEEAIRRTSAGGSTSLYNAIYIALRELGKLTPDDEREAPRRRVIVVLSDGEDTSSLVNFDQVIDAASRSDAVIYTIGLGVGATLRRSGREAGEFVLRRLAQQTGGSPFFISSVRELADVYGRIRDELASQYSLAYESSTTRDGQWRRLQVRVNRPNTLVRTRAGYFAGK